MDNEVLYKIFGWQIVERFNNFVEGFLGNLFYYLPVVLIAIGIYGIVSQRNLFKQLLSLAIADTGANMLLVAIGYISNMEAPIYSPSTPIARFVDPLPQALVLTAIVIGVGVLALGAALLVKVYEKYGTLEIDKLKLLKDELSERELSAEVPTGKGKDEGDVGA